MLEGADIPQSPAWWIKILAVELQNRRHGRNGGKLWGRSLSKPIRSRPGLDLLHDHLRGDPPLLGVADGWRDHFREVARVGRLNVAALVVEAKANRMGLAGFRTAAAGDDFGDKLATELLRENNMKVRAREVHDGMLSLSDSYAMVTPPRPNKRFPVITAEDAREVITAHDAATGETLAGLKLYRDEWDAADFAHLYLRVTPDDGEPYFEHHVAKHVGRTSSISESAFRMGQSWRWDGDVAHLERMPIVRFANRGGRGEFERHLDTLDRINDQILNKVVIAKVQAFRQMAIKGLPDSEKVLEDGKIVEREIDYDDAFIAAPGSMWQLPEGAELWESTPTDLGPLRLAIKDDLEHLAAVTSTPLHTITPDAASGSAEGASLMREEHVYAVEACRDHAEAGWAEVVATAFAFMGEDERAQQSQIEPIWAPIERYSLSEKASAAVQSRDILPIERIWTDIYQYPPSEVINLRQLQGRDRLTIRLGQSATQPPAAPLTPTFQPPAIQAGSDGSADA